MKTFFEALAAGFPDRGGYRSFRFGPDDRYELAFEPLISDGQWDVALYEDGALLTEKVVVLPGHRRDGFVLP